MKKVKALRDELSQIKNRLLQIGVELEEAQQRLDATKKKEAQAESQVLKLRSERQDLLADGGSLEEINALIDTARKSEELLEDEIEGLSRKIARLGDENKQLSARGAELKKAVFKEELIRPLIEKYNDLAPHLAAIVTQIDAAAVQYQKEFSTAGQRLVQSYPNAQFHGVATIPAIWIYGEEELPEYYNRKISAEKSALDEMAVAVRARYPNARCFKCEDFKGIIDQFGNCSCSSLRAIIPQTILTGQATHKNTPELSRCRYGTRAAE